jgi:hypothetical protein
MNPHLKSLIKKKTILRPRFKPVAPPVPEFVIPPATLLAPVLSEPAPMAAPPTHEERQLQVLLDVNERYTDPLRPVFIECADRTLSLKDLQSEVIKRVYTNLLAHHLVGVQPISHPISHVHHLAVRPMRPAAGPEFTSPFELADETPRIGICCNKHVVETRSRWLCSQLPIDEMLFFRSEDIIQIVANEVSEELDSELIRDLCELAPVSRWRGNYELPAPGHLSPLGFQLRRVSNAIAQVSRRGTGNWCVVGAKALDVLALGNDFEPTGSSLRRHGVVGTHSGSIKVIYDPYIGDKILVGYKGNFLDTGYVYSPLMLAHGGVWIDPATLVPSITFTTRYGITTFAATEQSYSETSHYYSILEID